MKPVKIYCACFFIILSVISCRKLDYYQVNPNSPSEATPALLLTSIAYSTFNVWPMDAAYAGRHMTYYERPNTFVNYGWGTGSFAAYDILRQVREMDKLAEKSGEENYRALAKFFRSVHFIYLTEIFGDVPYSEALQALEENTKPKYDLQEDIYAGVLKELEDANTMLDPSKGTIVGDIIYSGNISKWKALINAFRLRVLIHLSKKESNTRLNIKQQFQQIISNPTKYPLLTGNADNGQLVFNNSALNNYYPIYQNNSVPSLAALEKNFVNILKDRKDPRLFKIAEPVTGKPALQYESYNGVDAGLTVADQQSTSQFASKIARRYIESTTNEPMIFLGYAEQEFLIAEAISRNWITGNVETRYNNGIRASMKFYGVADTAIERYLAEPNVKLDLANPLPMILTQKYISFFMNSFWEPFFEQRRTGVPFLSVGPGTLNNKLVPKRWMYPQSEYNYNKANVTEAVNRQFGGKDDVNELMWVLK